MSDNEQNNAISVMSIAYDEDYLNAIAQRVRPEGVYLTDAHIRDVNAAQLCLKKAQTVFFTSSNSALAHHYKELCITVLSRNKEVRIINFDPLSGPGLLPTLNHEFEAIELADLTTVDSARKDRQLSNGVMALIIDNERLVAESDWMLISSLASHLRAAKIGVLSLAPLGTKSSVSVRLNGANTQTFEFSVPRPEEVDALLNFCAVSDQGELVLDLLSSIGLPELRGNSDIEVSNKPLDSPESSIGLMETLPEVQSDETVSANEVSHLSLRVFFGLAVMEVLVFSVYSIVQLIVVGLNRFL